jgi:hypothetical protein
MGSFPSRGRFLVDVVVTFADGAKSSLNSIWVWVFKKVLWVRGSLYLGVTRHKTWITYICLVDDHSKKIN